MSKKRLGANQKQDVVLRLLRGEGIEELSREMKISVGDLTKWQKDFLRAGQEGLKSRKVDPLQKDLDKAEQTIGRLTMKLELYKKKENFQVKK